MEIEMQSLEIGDFNDDNLIVLNGPEDDEDDFNEDDLVFEDIEELDDFDDDDL